MDPPKCREDVALIAAFSLRSCEEGYEGDAIDRAKSPWSVASRREVVPTIDGSRSPITRSPTPFGHTGIYGTVHHKNLALGVLPIDREETRTWLANTGSLSMNTVGKFPRAVARSMAIRCNRLHVNFGKKPAFGLSAGTSCWSAISPIRCPMNVRWCFWPGTCLKVKPRRSPRKNWRFARCR